MIKVGAVGVPLQAPAQLYPTTIGLGGTVSSNSPTNVITLPAGANTLIPPGTWMVSPGIYSFVQVLDPVTNTYRTIPTYGVNGTVFVESDGVNYRVANLTGYPIGAVVNSTGSGYTSVPTLTATGGSTWQGFIGGSVSAINIKSASSGTNYGVAPIVHIAAPPSPGIPATAAATVNSAGAITLITMVNQGAGYGTTAPAVTIVPSNSDPNALSTSTVNITNATATAVVSYVGMLTGVLMTNEGNNAQTSTPGMTFAGGAGSGALATILMDFAVTGLTATTPGSGYAAPVFIVSTGGTVTSTLSTPVNPAMNTLMVNRHINVVASIGSGTGVSTVAGNIVDGGQFQQVPTLVVLPGPSVATSGAGNTAATITAVVGGVNDTVFITPL